MNEVFIEGGYLNDYKIFLFEKEQLPNQIYVN